MTNRCLHVIYTIFYGWRPLAVALLILITHSTIVAETSLEQAETAFQRGAFEQAIEYWQITLDFEELEASQHFDILVKLAVSYQALGLSDRAELVLTEAEQLTLNSLKGDKTRQTLLFAVLSDLFLATHQETLSRIYADKSIKVLPIDAPSLIQATVSNNLANVYNVEAYYDKAIELYTKSVVLAKQANDLKLVTRILINKAHAHFKNQQQTEAITALYEAQQLLESVPIDYLKVFNLIGIGELAQRISQSISQRYFPPLPLTEEEKTLRSIAFQTLKIALDLAEKMKHSRLISYASGYLGQLYENEQRYTEALPLTRQAIFFAQQVEATEILYRWQWQLGRLFKAQQQTDQAIEVYRKAIENLQPIRQELTVGYRYTSQPFRETTGPVFFELADLLLKKAVTAIGIDKTHWLKEARDTIESFKTAELQDYFQDDCVTEIQSKLTAVSTGIPYTAVIYPILLPDRTEILLSLPKGIQQFSIPVTTQLLREEVNEFRFEMESRDSDAFQKYAQRLYQWLMAPLEEMLTLQEIETLIIVPDDVLRTIPFAALHDGKQFLISKYAFVTVPGLTLTDTKPTIWHNPKILIGGLSEKVQNHAALANVREELQLIDNLYPKQATVLLNESFTTENFAERLENTVYNIVHIASHGQFSSQPKETFLLTHDGKLTMNLLEQQIRLGKSRNKPLELLTLSACETAVGDDQAALGLAGVAIKAGARTAVATLWSVDDKATTLIIGEFYRQLQREQVSKAKALQNAQKFLLKKSRYQHPAFWASFLLIGNWY
ncbi:MAG: hypothetical protein BWK79_16640 [Beggiatoa sp. IS2]|nr:MAG: hypothetical protein BWK79_16640 [Beggiatoa sp. IS2]